VSGTLLLLAIGILSAGTYCLGLALEQRRLSLLAKPLPVLCLLLWVLQEARGPYARFVALALAISLVADILIEVSFLAGLATFLLAHVAYIVAFSTENLAWRPLQALPFLAWGVGVLVLLWPRLGQMRTPVVAYVVVICAMMWRAAARIDGAPVSLFADWLALGGAVVFAASDTLIALDRFQAPIRGVRFPIILLYWLGQWGIALSTRAS
jgi:alkenylglycerophosphocholine/alkenylglycerophosphoethanolamine hydrolase